MTPPRLYKPHIFKSVVRPGLWACVTAQKWPHRKLRPVLGAPVFYGAVPAQAYARWQAYYSKL